MARPKIFPWIVATLLAALAPALIVAALLAEFLVASLIASPAKLPAVSLSAIGGAVALAALYLIPTFVVALTHAVVLGLPVALVCRAMRWTGWLAALLAGFLVGAAPVGFLRWLLTSSRTAGSGQGVPTIIGGVPMRLDDIRWVAIAGGFGLAAALTFRFVLRRYGVLPAGGADLPAPLVGPADQT